VKIHKDDDLVGAILRDEDLRGQDLSNKTLFSADLRGAKLYDAIISLNCKTFDHARFDDDQIASLLFMIASADIHVSWKTGLYRLIKERLGADRYHALKRLLKVT
jgi:hypothetical protein